MIQKTIHITNNDMKRLRELIADARHFKKEDKARLEELEKELDNAVVVKAQDIPQDVITMNSEVHLRDLKTNDENIYRLVFPCHADASQGRISVLAPIGTALLGYSVGDVIEWEVPAGSVKLKVEKIVYQPEASGDYHL
jgi:regulator of nucleoside diphosphate kinase